MAEFKARITPACAGITGLYCAALEKVEDHPRVCGNNILNNDQLGDHEGSPPRVRE